MSGSYGKEETSTTVITSSNDDEMSAQDLKVSHEQT